MIPKRWDDIDEEALASLISNAVSEDRTIEYKRELPSPNHAGKTKFLAAVSSFANTAGGDLIFGMEEQGGTPTKIGGIQSADLDQQIRRLESLMESGLDPRINTHQYRIKTIDCCSHGKVLVIRVNRSWIGPHRVILEHHDKFYGRNSRGKYPLDVTELRAAFTLPATVTERVRAFRADRIIGISNGDTPVPLPETPKIVLHCVPIESFASQQNHDLLPFYQDFPKLYPMGATDWSSRLNLEGLLAFDGAVPSVVYTQLYRNGVIEVVDAYSFAPERNRVRIIRSVVYERKLFDYLPSCFNVLREMGINASVFVALTFTGTRGLQMDIEGFPEGNPIRQDSIVTPGVMVSEIQTQVGKVLKPMFDLVWNACGLPATRNLDSEGNWIQRR